MLSRKNIFYSILIVVGLALGFTLRSCFPPGNNYQKIAAPIESDEN